MNYKTIFIICLYTVEGISQDVEQSLKDTKKSLKEDPLSVTGSIGANTVWYQAKGIPPRRDPFYWVLNANLTFSFLNKVTVPFSAVFTQQDKNYSNGLDKFSQPFNQFGLSPKYKWLTVHAGFRSLEFSEYTLSGAMFLGGGVEIKPEKSLISGTAFYGRFVKAIPKGGVDGIVVSLPAYERRGGGAKIKVGNEQHSGEFIFLKVRDDINSIPFDTALPVTPQENEVLGIGTKQRINKWVSASGDLSFSMFTKNLFQQETKLQRFTYVNQIYSPRPSSQFNKAFNVALDFSPGRIKFGLKYKRIDPDYRTLGAVFLTNDLEEISANTLFTLFKNKMNLNAATGLQRNNLDRVQVLTSRRVISSLNISYNLNQHLNLSANYSNFSSNTLPVRDVFTDSIRFVQLTQNSGVAFNYAFGKNKIKHTIYGSSTYQESGGNKQKLNTFLNGTFSYNFNIPHIGFAITGSFIYNKNTNGLGSQNEGLGPTLGFQKILYRTKIRLMLNAGYQDAFLNSEILNKNYCANFGFSFSIDAHQNLKADLSYLEKKAVKGGSQQYSEIRGNLGYVYNFGIKKKTLKK